MKVWISKHAMTAGVVEREVEVSADFPDMAVDRSGRYAQHYHGEGKDWHRTREAAVAKAEQMRNAKILSLEKSIRKIQALTF